MKPHRNTTEFIEAYERFLTIDQNDLDNAIIQHPELYWHICRELQFAISDRDELKDKLKKIDAELFLSFKQEFESAGTRATEAVLSASIESDDLHLEALANYRDKCAEVGMLDALKAAFEQRSYALKELVSMYCVNYTATSNLDAPPKTPSAIEAQVNKDRAAIKRRVFVKGATAHE